MKNVLFREALREIRHSSSRFFSILAIVGIGCGFFSGVKAACPDMKLTAEQYFSESNLADLHLISTWGFDEDDLAEIGNDEDIRVMEPCYSYDVLAESADGDQLVIKTIGYNEDAQLNLPRLHEGRLPEAKDECVIGTSSMGETHWEIGDTIELTGDGEDLSESMDTTSFTVVGIAQLPQYFGYSYGTTNISDGVLDGIMLIPEEDYTLDVYTDVYLTLNSTQGLSYFSEEYEQAVDETNDRLEQLANVRSETRYGDTIDEANQEIADVEEEIAEGEQELADAEAELADARAELDDGWAEYYDGKAEADKELADAQKKIDDGARELADGEAEWQKNYDSYQEAVTQLSDSRKQLDDYIAQAEQLESQLAESAASIEQGNQLIEGLQGIYSGFAEQSVSDVTMLDENTQAVITASASLDSTLPDLLTGYITSSGREKRQYGSALEEVISGAQTTMAENEALYEQGQESLTQLQQGITDGEAEYAAGKQKLDEAKVQLDDGKQELDDARAELEQGRRELETARADADKELADGLAELEDGEKEYEDGLAEYETQRQDAEKEIEEARQEIEDAREELEDLQKPEWYLLDHDSFPGVGTISDDAEKVDAIAAVFPVFFVLVAALVCLTTMTRMVEEERTQIGTMKALGFSRGAVMFKFILYAVLASVIGSIAGCLLGLKLLPYVIIGCYKAMYQVPYILLPIRWGYLAGCMVVSVFCTSIVTVITCYGVMNTVPAQLMRPKSPKNGKRILLERVGFFWKRLSFSGKVTCRNLFRYKSRVLMTVIGVAGCTALMLTGFGLRYAISSISERQYGEVFVYDSNLSLSDNQSPEQVETLIDETTNTEGVTGVMALTSKQTDVLSSDSKKTVVSVSMYIPGDPDGLEGFINLRDSETGEPLSLTDDGCVITEKLSQLLSVEAGDSILLRDSTGEKREVKVTGIAETYVSHYVYLTPTLYESLFRESAEPTALLLTMDENADTASAYSSLLQLDGVQGLVGMSYYADAFSDLVASLNMIVWVLIGAAAALAVIVMYNLININVSERVRELATIKVLGFYDREVSDYICRENTAAALMGMLVGLVGGIALEEFVVNTAEVDVVLFVHGLPVSAYLLSAGLTIVFILLVNQIVHHSLKKIDMVQSLKSVE